MMTPSRWLLIGTAVTIALGALEAEAGEVLDEGTQSCLRAFDEAQAQRADGSLLEARRSLEVCSAKICPAAVADRCVEWLDGVEADLPTVVLSARASSGDALSDVTVMEGDVVLATNLDGEPIAFDPGPHALVLHHPAGTTLTVEVIARSGEKNRLVEVQFEPAEPATGEPLPSPSMPLPVAPAPIHASPSFSDGEAINWSPLIWTGFGVAGAGAIVGSVMGGVALGQYDDLEKQCAVGCTEDEIAGGRVYAHVATGAFVVAGAGAVLGGVALGMYLTSDDDAGSVGVAVGPTWGRLSVRF